MMKVSKDHSAVARERQPGFNQSTELLFLDIIRILNPLPGGPCFTSPERIAGFLRSGKGRMRDGAFEFFSEHRERRLQMQADEYDRGKRSPGEDFVKIATVHRNIGNGSLTYTQWIRK